MSRINFLFNVELVTLYLSNSFSHCTCMVYFIALRSMNNKLREDANKLEEDVDELVAEIDSLKPEAER